MRFDRLLWECLKPGAFEHDDKGIAARLTPVAGETVLLFLTDCESFRDGKQGVKVCDLLFFVRAATDAAPALLFVELKGGDFEHAQAQVRSTLERVEKELHESCRGGRVRLCGVILLGTVSPQNTKAMEKDLLQELGVRFRIQYDSRRGTTDLRPYLESARARSKPTKPAAQS